MHVTTYRPNFYFGFGNSLLCLSCVCEWDGWGEGWLGWVLFFTFWVWCGDIFLFKHFWPSDSHFYEKFMHGVGLWDLNHFFPFFLSLSFFLNHAYSYTYVFFVIPIILRV